MVTRYVPVDLPARIDMSIPNTAQQLSIGLSGKRLPGPHETSHRSDMRCRIPNPDALVRESMAQFVEAYPRPVESVEALFGEFLRFFHSEYDDVWYVNNCVRLVRSFKPLWEQFMSSKHYPIEEFTDASNRASPSRKGPVNLLD